MVVWLDCFITNVDRTVRNTNMLIWNKELWLIDHGASLYMHHSWEDRARQAERPFVQVKDHVLLPYASKLNEVNERCKSILTVDLLESIVSLIPDDWLEMNLFFSRKESIEIRT